MQVPVGGEQCLGKVHMSSFEDSPVLNGEDLDKTGGRLVEAFYGMGVGNEKFPILIS